MTEALTEAEKALLNRLLPSEMTMAAALAYELGRIAEHGGIYLDYPNLPNILVLATRIRGWLVNPPGGKYLMGES